MTTFAGFLFPASWLASQWYATLSAFVAVNTLVYVVLSVSKTLPRLHPTEWLRRDGVTRRRESRSIHPEVALPDVSRGRRPAVGAAVHGDAHDDVA